MIACSSAAPLQATSPPALPRVFHENSAGYNAGLPAVIESIIRMQYISTRGRAPAQSFSEILLGGLAPDGGLYLPAAYPQVSGAELNAWRKLSYADLALEILKKFATDIPEADLMALTRK